MGKLNILMDDIEKYSSKKGEKEREMEIFKELEKTLSCNLKDKIDILLKNKKVEDLIESTTGKPNVEFISSERRKHETKFCEEVNRETEREICKCMFYKNINKCNCSNCKITRPWINISNQYEVIDYEFPMPFKHGLRKRNVDLVLFDKGNDKYYAVEMKPPKKEGSGSNNKDTISKMMAETLTYTSLLEYGKEYGKKNGKTLLPAIAFFEDTIQYNKFREYKALNNPIFDKLVKKIKVFKIIRKDSGKEYEFEFIEEK